MCVHMWVGVDAREVRWDRAPCNVWNLLGSVLYTHLSGSQRHTTASEQPEIFSEVIYTKQTKLSGWWRHCTNPLPSVSCRRLSAGPHHSPCEPRTLCTWSMLVSHRWGSRCWSSPPHAGHTSAAVALFWAGVACRVKTEIDLWYDVKVKDLHW